MSLTRERAESYAREWILSPTGRAIVAKYSDARGAYDAALELRREQGDQHETRLSEALIYLDGVQHTAWLVIRGWLHETKGQATSEADAHMILVEARSILDPDDV